MINRSVTAVVMVLVAIAAIWLFVFKTDKGATQRRLIGITQIATHPALDEVRIGIIKRLAERGYSNGGKVEIVFRNANGDASLTLPIAQEFVRSAVAVIVPISTPSSISVVKTTDKIPVVFSGVTDPIAAGVVKNLENPGGNVTGVSDRWPFEAQVKTFAELFPMAKRIGMLFTRGDDVSKIGVEAVQATAPKLGLELKLQAVGSALDIYPSAVALLRDVDAVFVGIDHLLLENMEALTKAANEAGKPLFGGETGSVRKGAVVALSIDMTEFGAVTGDLVADVLDGKNPGDIPIKTVSSGKLHINAEAAKRFGLDVSALRTIGAVIFE